MDNRSFNPSPASSWQPENLPADLQAIADTYASQPVPRPSSDANARLMQRLLTEAAYVNQERQIQEPDRLWQTLALVRWRVYLLGPLFWISGMLLILFGGLLSSHSHVLASHSITLLVLLLPLTVVLGLAYALRTPSEGLRAIEASCPVNFVQTALGLGLAILAFDILLGLVATVIFSMMSFVPFWNLLLAWLAPLLLLSAISLPLALLRGVRLAALVGGLPWLLLGISALAEQNAKSWTGWLFSAPQGTLALSSHLAMIVFSLIVLGILLLSAPRWQHFCTL
jgi:hypothetical protein